MECGMKQPPTDAAFEVTCPMYPEAIIGSGDGLEPSGLCPSRQPLGIEFGRQNSRAGLCLTSRACLFGMTGNLNSLRKVVMPA
jgi:hypothetical protein